MCITMSAECGTVRSSQEDTLSAEFVDSVIRGPDVHKGDN